MAWRDTLYLWRGQLQIERQEHNDSSGEQDEMSNVSWSGTRINCPDCPDSRQAPVPTSDAFESSPLSFEFKGTIRGNVTDAAVVSLTSGTWRQHASEGKSSHLDALSSKTDTTHKLNLSRWLKQTHVFAHDSLVLGMGSNEYGHFLEMGWMEPVIMFRHNVLDDHNKKLKATLTLARRYLPQHDERSTWSFDRFFSEMKLGVPPILGNDVWSHVAPFLHNSRYIVNKDIPPWQQHVVLHTFPYMVKRNNQGLLLKVGGGPTLTAGDTPLPLNMPTPNGKPFQLRLTLDDDGEASVNTTWMKQCWGCGGSSVKKEVEFDCHCMMLDDQEGEGVPYAIPYPWIKRVLLPRMFRQEYSKDCPIDS